MTSTVTRSAKPPWRFESTLSGDLYFLYGTIKYMAKSRDKQKKQTKKPKSDKKKEKGAKYKNA